MKESVKAQLLSLSFIQELRQNDSSRERCWIDGSRCSYGVPEGQFELRPQGFCLDCQKIPGIRGEIAEFCDDGDDEEEEKKEEETTLSEWLVANEPITLSGALADLLGNKELEFEEDEKKLLEATIEMLKEDKDPEIFYAKDLKDEK